MKLIERAFRKVDGEKIDVEWKMLDAMFSADPKLKEMAEHLYEELNIIDRKLSQISILNGGLMIAGGVLFRTLPGIVTAVKEISGFLALTLIGLFSVAYLWAAIAALLAAVPGLVSAASVSSRVYREDKRLLRKGKSTKRYLKAAIGELIKVKLVRNRKYYKSVVMTILAVVFLAASIILASICHFITLWA